VKNKLKTKAIKMAEKAFSFMGNLKNAKKSTLFN